MASTTNKNIEQPTYNQYAADPTGWTTPVNNNWGRIDTALGAVQPINLGGAGAITVTLTTTYPIVSYPSGGNASYIPMILSVTGAMTGNCIIRVPSGVCGQWIVVNATTGAFTLTVDNAAGGTSVACTQGYSVTVYSDGTNIAKTNTVPIANNSVTNAMLATVATQTIKGRTTAGTGNVEDLTVSQILDFISTTQGSILYRNATTWVSLSPGSSGQFLQTNGSGANPAWGTPPSVLPTQTGNSAKLLTTDGTNPSWSGDSSVRARASFSNGTSTNPTIASGSVNIASITRTTTGRYDIVFTNNLNSANYQVAGMAYNSSYPGTATWAVPGTSKTSSGFSLQVALPYVTAFLDFTNFDIVIYGGF
jgi:hypothetical protein